MDMDYAVRQSFWLNAKIIMQTSGAVLHLTGK